MCDVVFCTCVLVNIVLRPPASPDKLLASVLSNLLHGCPTRLGRPAGVRLVCQLVKAHLCVPVAPFVPHESGFSMDLAASRMPIASYLTLIVGIMRSLILGSVSVAHFFNIILRFIDYCFQNDIKACEVNNVKQLHEFLVFSIHIWIG